MADQPAPAREYPAGRARYHGRIDPVIGLFAETTYGTLLRATEQEYDEATDTTTVQFVHHRPPEPEQEADRG